MRCTRARLHAALFTTWLHIARATCLGWSSIEAASPCLEALVLQLRSLPRDAASLRAVVLPPYRDGTSGDPEAAYCFAVPQSLTVDVSSAALACVLARLRQVTHKLTAVPRPLALACAHRFR